MSCLCVCTTFTANTILDTNGPLPLGYKRMNKLNYMHLLHQKLTKYASCQLCRFIGKPEDKLQKVKSNIAYCSDCNVHLCMNCYKPFHCQTAIASEGARHAWRMYLCSRKEENEGYPVLEGMEAAQKLMMQLLRVYLNKND